MRFVAYVAAYKILSIIGHLRDRDLESRLRVFVGLFVVVVFFAASLCLFYYIFDYLTGLYDIGYLLIDKIVSIGFLAIFIMLGISNAATSVSTFYNSRETESYLALPTPHLDVFVSRFIDNTLYSTWGVLFLTVPMVIAYGLIREFAWWQHLAQIGLLLPFVLIPACLGTTLTIVLYLQSRHISPRSVLILVITAAVVGGLVYLKLGQTTSLTHDVLADYRVLNRFLGSLAATSFPFLPSFWVAECMKAFAGQEGASFGINALALISTTVLLVRLTLVVASRYYYRSWQAAVESGGRTRRETRRLSLPQFFGLPRWLASDFKSVLAKDLKLFVRDPAQWGQFTILLMLLFVYLMNLRHFPSGLTDRFWSTVISFANFAFTGFILATLSVRFVYPNFSLEGKSFWAIAASPMPLKRLFWEKFWLAFIVFMLIAEILGLVSNLMLRLEGWMMLLCFFSILLMSVSLTSLAVGMGAIFPKLDESNPGRIASSLGGMLTTVLSLVYVALMVIILAVPTYYYSLQTLEGRTFPIIGFILPAVMLLFLNLTTSIVPIRIGVRKLSAREF